MTTNPIVRHIFDWHTTAVTALPGGWVNRFEVRDDSPWDGKSPAPAILLQEMRGWYNTYADGTSEYRAAERPYDVRAVFAAADGANLEPADDAHNYQETTYEPEWKTHLRTRYNAYRAAEQE